MTTVRCVSLLVAILAGSAGAEVRLPNIISDGMVLQQKTPTPIWGKAAVGEKVTVTFAGQTKTATVGKDRRWSVTLDPLDASASPRVMTINDIKISDVLVGEVWLASGDGGMEFNLAELPEEEKKAEGAEGTEGADTANAEGANAAEGAEGADKEGDTSKRGEVQYIQGGTDTNALKTAEGDASTTAGTDTEAKATPTAGAADAKAAAKGKGKGKDKGKGKA